MCFQTLKNADFVKFIPIHNTRWDGISRYVGDGGTYGRGVSLREGLEVDKRYDHEAAIRTSPKTKKFGDIEYSKARAKEFDYEHAEAALEAGADFFLTDDKTRKNAFAAMTKQLPHHEGFRRIQEICFFPVDAVSRIL